MTLFILYSAWHPKEIVTINVAVSGQSLKNRKLKYLWNVEVFKSIQMVRFKILIHFYNRKTWWLKTIQLGLNLPSSNTTRSYPFPIVQVWLLA